MLRWKQSTSRGGKVGLLELVDTYIWYMHDLLLELVEHSATFDSLLHWYLTP